jgi:hypothetical protein
MKCQTVGSMSGLPESGNLVEDRMPFDQLHRREFIWLLGVAPAAWPLTGRAAVREADDRISPWRIAWTDQLRGFHRGLKDAGFVEGENVAIRHQCRTAAGHRHAALAIRDAAPSLAASVSGDVAIHIGVACDQVVASGTERLRPPRIHHDWRQREQAKRRSMGFAI